MLICCFWFNIGSFDQIQILQLNKLQTRSKDATKGLLASLLGAKKLLVARSYWVGGHQIRIFFDSHATWIFLYVRPWPEAADAVRKDLQWQESSAFEPSLSWRWNLKHLLCEICSLWPKIVFFVSLVQYIDETCLQPTSNGLQPNSDGLQKHFFSGPER